MGANESANLHSETGTTVPVRRRAHTSYTRSPPDYFGSPHVNKNHQTTNNNNNNNDEKQKNSNIILTEFDVKQMMARSRAGTVCVSSMSRRQSSEETEKSILETVRQATDEESTSSGMSKKGSISSRKSTGSHDSGVGTHPNSPIASSFHLPTTSSSSRGDEQTLPVVPKITVSLAEDTNETEEKKKQRNLKRAIMKKVFKKKSAKVIEMRTRSKSLGSPNAMYSNGKFCMKGL
ncbi:hypothetical protein GCK72_018843 [Caenorhabditis remanei]|uniref:Uncharacterized protein n=1 Tax=Caenorhabditis remanei TaxID=31234 RepID=A0A6A5GD08_CAERE|nr:hypothetical protein GCK72_018843 [Caenorhabditis remanei]KAF1752289.1 hypothetical protein GCK72_018843 [Caenorhabditis remanei]